MNLRNAGKLESILIDEKVPVEEEGEKMFILHPANHTKARDLPSSPKGKRFGSPKTKQTFENEVDIWPQLLAKAKAKSLGSYERLLGQDLCCILADLTGMPVKKIDTTGLEFKWIREGFKHSCLMICKAKRAWMSQAKNDSVDGTSDRELLHWNISQALELPYGKIMVEVKNHFCTNKEKMSRCQ